MNISRLASLTLIALAAASMIRVASALEPQGGPPPGVFPQPDEQPVQATLITEHASIQPDGTTRVGVLFELEEGWHIYAQDPGDAGLPTKVVWRTPGDVSVGPLNWPPAQEFIEPGGIQTHGYAGAVVLYSVLTFTPLIIENSEFWARWKELPQGLILNSTEPPIEKDVVDLLCHVEWLACREICIPGEATLKLLLPIRPEVPVASTHAELFDHVN